MLYGLFPQKLKRGRLRAWNPGLVEDLGLYATPIIGSLVSELSISRRRIYSQDQSRAVIIRPLKTNPQYSMFKPSQVPLIEQKIRETNLKTFWGNGIIAHHWSKEFFTWNESSGIVEIKFLFEANENKSFYWCYADIILLPTESVFLLVSYK